MYQSNIQFKENIIYNELGDKTKSPNEIIDLILEFLRQNK